MPASPKRAHILRMFAFTVCCLLAGSFGGATLTVLMAQWASWLTGAVLRPEYLFVWACAAGVLFGLVSLVIGAVHAEDATDAY